MSTQPVILFVCEHGAAKSVIAARHFERLARASGLSVECRSAGVEPDPEIPAHVIAGLAGDGLEASIVRPVRATSELLAEADRIVTFGCDLSALGAPGQVVRWDGVPMVSDGYEAARDAILNRLRSLLAELVPVSR
jgi:arsenate reductase (thioredoxin)